MKLPALPIDPLISIICRADEGTLSDFRRRAVAALNHSRLRLEIIAVLDCRQDYGEMITSVDGRSVLRIVSVEMGPGEAGSLNAAYAVCAGDLICCPNAIDDISLDGLSLMIERLRRQPAAGLVLRTPASAVERLGGWMADELVREGGRWVETDDGFAVRREVAEKLFPIPDYFELGARHYLVTLALWLTEAVSESQPLSKNLTAAPPTEWLSHDRIRGLVAFMIEREAAINLRLDELGLAEYRFELEHDLSYRQLQLALLLLEHPSSRRVMTSLVRFIPRLLLDDRLTARRKLAAIAAYVATVVLSGESRLRWLSNALRTAGVSEHYAGLVGSQKIGN